MDPEIKELVLKQGPRALDIHSVISIHAAAAVRAGHDRLRVVGCSTVGRQQVDPRRQLSSALALFDTRSLTFEKSTCQVRANQVLKFDDDKKNLKNKLSFVPRLFPCVHL